MALGSLQTPSVSVNSSPQPWKSGKVNLGILKMEGSVFLWITWGAVLSTPAVLAAVAIELATRSQSCYMPQPPHWPQ